MCFVAFTMNEDVSCAISFNHDCLPSTCDVALLGVCMSITGAIHGLGYKTKLGVSATCW